MKLLMKLAALCFCLLLRAADNPPELSARDVVRSADRKAGAVAPGEIVILFPSNAGPETLAPSERNPDGRVSTRISDTRVLFDDIPAPMVYSIRGEVSAVVPYEISNKKVTHVVVEYRGLRSAPVPLPVVESAPALFTLDSSGIGQAAMLNETGCCNSARNPAARGSVVSLYATGEGQTNPPRVKLIAMAVALDPDTLRSADLLGAQAVLTDTMTSQSMLHRVRELLRPRIVPYVAPGL